MARLPVPGSDTGTWGDILNDFLLQSHNSDGTIKDTAAVKLSGDQTVSGVKTFSSSPVVPTPGSGTDATNKTYVDNTVAAGAPDATTTNKGLVQLAGDLAGTATSPQIATGVIVNADVNASAAIAQSKIANLTTDLAAKKTDSMSTNKLLGRGTASTGAIEEITLGTNLSLTGTTLNASGSGDVVGPASATDNAIVRYDGTTGKLVQDSQVTIDDNGRIVSATSGSTGGLLLGGDVNLYRSAADTLKTDDTLIVGTPGTAAGSVATIDGTQTVTNKRITKRIATLTDAATVTPATDSFDGGKLTTLSQDSTIANPTGTPTEFQQYTLRIKSTSARALTWGAQYRGGNDIPLPTTTTGSSKTDYFGFQWNADDSKWDIIAIARGY